ncbi:MAG: hypothetical protein ACREK9_02285, partial [Candidatus Rokuibacteriota bacterium]
MGADRLDVPFHRQSRGRGFNSRRARHFKRFRAIAHLDENPGVDGAVPASLSATATPHPRRRQIVPHEA